MNSGYRASTRPSLRGHARRRGQRFSTVLRLIGEHAGDRIQLAQLTGTFGDRAFGALMFVFAVLNLIPLPPGSSSVLGAPLIVIAAQLALGRTVLWLPGTVARRSIDTRDYQRLVARGLPTLRYMERLLAPRLEFMFGAFGDRLIGLACLTLAVILFLPIPFGNMLPAFAIAVFSLGLMQRDGAVVLIGWAVALASLVIVALVSGALVIAAGAILQSLRTAFGV